HNNPLLYPRPLLGLAAIASRTRRLRLGTGVLLLPLYRPLDVAEEDAIVDVISNGRLILGVGAGYAPEEFEAFDVSMTERGSAGRAAPRRAGCARRAPALPRAADRRRRAVPSGRWRAIPFGASSPSTMWSAVMIVNPTEMAIAWAVAGANRPTRGCSTGSIVRASAGSPNQPNARDGIVLPSWHAATDAAKYRKASRASCCDALAFPG